jgi:hypothetical protein
MIKSVDNEHNSPPGIGLQSRGDDALELFGSRRIHGSVPGSERCINIQNLRHEIPEQRSSNDSLGDFWIARFKETIVSCNEMPLVNETFSQIG